MTQEADSTTAAAGATTPAAVSRVSQLAALLERALPGQLRRVANHTGELTYEVAAADLLRAASALRDGAGLQFEMCMDVCGVDYLEHGRAEWKTQHATLSGFSRGVARGEAPDPADGAEGGMVGDNAPPGRRFAVVYHLQ